MERWTDRPVEFHFATILSPWIRRALVAGGFGTGLPASSGPREIAPVVPYRGGYDEPHTSQHSPTDVETLDVKNAPQSPSVIGYGSSSEES